MVPPLREPPAAVTVLDLQHEVYPRWFSTAELAYRRVIYHSSIRRARLVIAISQHVADTVVERLRIPSERIRVVPLGLDHLTFNVGAPRRREPLIVYPARRWAHKNHERLFAAFALVRRMYPEVRLVLTGFSRSDGAVPEGVVSYGYVPRESLVDLYRSASALVFPSLYEGFGQPAIEAMACGCPVAASRAAALPEVCGDAARYFDPWSVEDMADAMLDVLDHGDRYRERGLARAARFDWDTCARAHERVYRELERNVAA
jgi:glycosyltransferase involved in cell wall biosynthesis